MNNKMLIKTASEGVGFIAHWQLPFHDVHGSWSNSCISYLLDHCTSGFAAVFASISTFEMLPNNKDRVRELLRLAVSSHKSDGDHADSILSYKNPKNQVRVTSM